MSGALPSRFVVVQLSGEEARVPHHGVYSCKRPLGMVVVVEGERSTLIASLVGGEAGRERRREAVGMATFFIISSSFVCVFWW